MSTYHTQQKTRIKYKIKKKKTVLRRENKTQTTKTTAIHFWIGFRRMHENTKEALSADATADDSLECAVGSCGGEVSFV
jgi:hypothetical protein